MSEFRPPRRLRLSRAIAAAQAPVLLPQGRRLRASTPRLPDAPLPWHGRVDGRGESAASGASRPLRLLVIGDSTAAGVGVDHADLGLGGRLAEALSARTGRPVQWWAAGRNGATARDLVRQFLRPALEQPYDLVFLTVGANDALGLRSARAFRRDIRRILERTFAAHPQTALLMSSLPAFFRFRLLPDPLRRSLYRHSQALEREARALVDAHPRSHMSPPPPPYTEGFFASDEFHPSAIGYRDWAEFAVDDADSVGFLRLLDDH
ncbi:MAG: SGNH/GDSL hydrolase family protein [Microcella sp.]|uniref:SGNH/GDSL hydrolase family protein n=1 Tax=Microcella sp. TaxID=1913979 RepID=UPI0033153D07